MRVVRRFALLAAVLVALGSLTPLSSGGTAHSAPVWAPAATAPIHPGVMTFTDGGQCTANFVYTDGTNVFIGQAAHCSGTGGNTETDGCTSGTLPVGTAVEVDGATRPGTMVYNSWATMQALNEANADTCAYNDLALVKLDPADYGKVNPSIPHWGGPVGVESSGLTVGETVYSYGNSSLRGGVSQTSPKKGTDQAEEGNGWSHVVMTYNPGVPGDSGSAFLDATGNAVGVLSTLQLGFPNGVVNGVGDISREIAYMQAHSSYSNVNLVNGTQPFNGSGIGVGVAGVRL